MRSFRALDGALLFLLGAALALRVLSGGAAAALEEPSLGLVLDLFVAAAALLAGAAVAVRGEAAAAPRGLWPGGALLSGTALALVGRAEGTPAALRAAVDWAALPALAFALWTALRPGASAGDGPGDVADGRARRAGAVLALVLGLGAVVAVAGALEYHVEADRTRAAYARDPASAEILPELREEFEARLGADQASGPFVIPNLLGAFLALVVPVAGAAGVGACAAGRRAAGAFLLALAAALVYGLSLAAAKGSWLALGAGLLAAFAVAGRSRLAAALLAAGAVGLFLTLAAAPRDLVARLPGATSFLVRRDYAAAALDMLAEKPLGGGPGTFVERYSRFRRPGAEETRFAHDDYLQALVEQGPLGLAGLVLFWGALLRATARRPSPPASAAAPPSPTPSPPHSPSPPRTPPGTPPFKTPVPGPAPAVLLLLGAAAGILLLPALGLRYRDLPHALAFAAVLLGVALPAGRALVLPAGRSPALLAAGAAGAVAALLASAGIDFVHHEAGLPAVALAAGLGGAALAGPAPARRPLSHGLRALVVALPAAAFLGLAHGLLPPALALDAAMAEAAAAARAGDLDAAARAYSRAVSAEPGEAAPLLALGDLERRRFEASGDPARLGAAVDAYEAAARLRPGAADIHFRLGQVLSRDAPLLDPRLDRTVAAFEAASRAYPTRARYRLHAAYAREKRGEPGEARRHLDAALSADAAETLGRLRLTPDERAAALRLRGALEGRAPDRPPGSSPP